MADRDEKLDTAKHFAKRTEPQGGNDAAYWAQIRQIKDAARKLAHDTWCNSSDAMTLDVACMMLNAAFEDRAKLLSLISDGYIRNARFVAGPSKPKREAL